MYASTTKDNLSDHSAGTYGKSFVEIRPKGEIKILDGNSREWMETMGTSMGREDSAKWVKKLKNMGYDAIKESNGEVTILNPDKFSFSKPGLSVDDAVKTKSTTLYHGSPNAQTIRDKGFTLDNVGKNSGYPGVYGKGVYLTDDAEFAGMYGDVMEIEVAPNLKLFSPKEDGGNDTLSIIFGRDTGYGDPDKIVEYYKSKGYDGIKVGNQTVIFDPKNVKVRK